MAPQRLQRRFGPLRLGLGNQRLAHQQRPQPGNHAGELARSAASAHHRHASRLAGHESHQRRNAGESDRPALRRHQQPIYLRLASARERPKLRHGQCRFLLLHARRQRHLSSRPGRHQCRGPDFERGLLAARFQHRPDRDRRLDPPGLVRGCARQRRRGHVHRPRHQRRPLARDRQLGRLHPRHHRHSTYRQPLIRDPCVRQPRQLRRRRHGRQLGRQIGVRNHAGDGDHTQRRAKLGIGLGRPTAQCRLVRPREPGQPSPIPAPATAHGT